MFKKLVGAGAAALMLCASALISPAAAEARPAPTTAEVPASASAPASALAPAGILDPWVSPNPEHSEFGKWSQQQATDWVNRCPPGRYCNWIRKGEYYTMFQFYKCGVYSLSGWLGTSNFFNNQNVSVQLLGRRHEVLRTHSPGQKFITNWDAVWYINLCA